ncbi:MAG: excinuclease ABC subunit UvrA [Verrucomicrobiia bacterium]
MRSKKENRHIRLSGVKQNNLKGFDLNIPLNRLVVITGPSGSGKSSLAFDTLYAEGQRRYIETFSPYARQFFDRMDKPRVDIIESIPPAIAIEQKNAVKTVRSTVGTMTEICDYMKVVMPGISSLYCKQCGRIVRREAPQDVWNDLSNKLSLEVRSADIELLITFDLTISQKLSLKDSLNLIKRQGYQRIFHSGQVLNIEEAIRILPSENLRHITVVQDRLGLSEAARNRFIESCEQAYHFGKGRLAVYFKGKNEEKWNDAPFKYSNHLHCAECNILYDEPSPSLFSYNHPVGACPKCHGFGRIIGIDYKLVIPNPNLSLIEGAIRPWQSGFSRECQDDLIEFCKKRGVPIDVPFKDLAPEHQKWVIDGDPDYGIDELHRWPRCWYGVKGYFDWLESRSYKMHIRVLLSRYRSYTTCPDCKGGRFQPETLLFKIEIDKGLAEKIQKQGKCVGTLITLADIYLMPITDALEVLKSVRDKIKSEEKTPIQLALDEVISRMEYLVQIGLGYLTLNRPSRTLSGGETERVNLTACLGSRLVNTLYILDEPSVGLHPRDTDRLIGILKSLRDIGNTVVVVEHEPSVIRSADQIIDLGPGSGENGGNIIFQGSPNKLLSHPTSLTGLYLSGRKKIEIPNKKTVCQKIDEKSVWLCPYLTLYNATRHNLKNLTVRIPLQRFVCVTGVSGSGKSTLIKECLLPALEQKLRKRKLGDYDYDPNCKSKLENGDEIEENEKDESGETHVEGAELIDSVVLVDQSPPGKTPRSNPALYIGAFEFIRDFFASSTPAVEKGIAKKMFSFNSSAGGCEHCNGSGYEKIEMQFLSDIFIKCPECDGTRYKKNVRDIKIQPVIEGKIFKWHKDKNLSKNIVDVLNGTVDEIVEWLELFTDSKPAYKARRMLEILQKVGLGYIRIGQPITTLSGGECQRLKLARSLAETIDFSEKSRSKANLLETGNRPRSILYLFDEPTTGLHFDDIRTLLNVFYELVDNGHSVVVIEHNLEVVKCADWIIDLGPEAGDDGGRVVVCGTVEDVIACPQSHTGRALKEVVN